MFMDHIPRCPCSWYVIQLHHRVVYVLYEEFMLEAGATTKGRDLRLEVRRIRWGAFRDRPGDMVWLDFMATHRHLVDVTVTSACTNTSVPHIGARLPLPGVVLHWELSRANSMRIFTLPLSLARVSGSFGSSKSTLCRITSSLWRMGAGWRLGRVSWVITWLFWWEFADSMAWVLRTLVYCVLTFRYVRMQHLVRRFTSAPL
jgi:hypothetical protein